MSIEDIIAKGGNIEFPAYPYPFAPVLPEYGGVMKGYEQRLEGERMRGLGYHDRITSRPFNRELIIELKDQYLAEQYWRGWIAAGEVPKSGD